MWPFPAPRDPDPIRPLCPFGPLCPLSFARLGGALVVSSTGWQPPFARGGEVDLVQFRVHLGRGGWTSLKEVEVSSKVFPAFRRGPRAPFSVTGEPAFL